MPSSNLASLAITAELELDTRRPRLDRWGWEKGWEDSALRGGVNMSPEQLEAPIAVGTRVRVRTSPGDVRSGHEGVVMKATYGPLERRWHFKIETDPGIRSWGHTDFWRCEDELEVLR